MLLRGLDSNQRPSGYEPDELPLLHPAIICLVLACSWYTRGIAMARMQFDFMPKIRYDFVDFAGVVQRLEQITHNDQTMVRLHSPAHE